MKYTDEYAGRILCRLLSLRGVQHSSPPGTESVKNILFIKFWGMGSIILSAPAVQSIRSRYPAAKLHFLSFGSNREILSLIPELDSIESIRLTNPFSFFWDTVKTIFKLRKQRFDIVFDFEFFTYYSALIARLIGAKFTVGFNNHLNRRRSLFSKTIEFNDHQHTRENFLRLVG
ncbi:MAG: glycosyltransferase family 9 protein [Ignavibacteria bacterium]|nr:glycosyltransferase family 9 protein [Ignavibacteria bacterium]